MSFKSYFSQSQILVHGNEILAFKYVGKVLKCGHSTTESY